MSLSEKKCIPCQGGTPPLSPEEVHALLSQVPKWSVVDNHHITRTLTFPNFVKALDYTNLVGDLAESQGHHPDIYLSWGKVTLTLYTHKINGLTESDFIFAAKCNDLPYQP